ncbi:MAG: amino acid adenylation domain-containing protein [Pseudomonadota bacterium]
MRQDRGSEGSSRASNNSRENIEDIYRLTPIQEGILFHTLLADEPGVYIEQFAQKAPLRIDGSLFQQAWNLVVARHPILRSGFVWEGVDKPVQVVLKQCPIDLIELDWSRLPDEEFKRKFDALRDEDRARTFDLKQAPLMRVHLVHADDAHSYVLWTYHHILLDGWSAFVVLDQVLSASRALDQSETPQFKSAPSYKQYVRWQQQQDEAKAEAFWREYLRGFASPTPLGLVEQPEWERHAEDYQILKRKLGADTAEKLRQFSRFSRLTLNTLLQGGWAYLLAIYSGEDDVLFGSTASGRPSDLPDSDKMVGLFINTLPCRMRIAPETRVIDWLNEVQGNLVRLRGFEHSALVQVQGWSEIGRGLPLFDSMLAVESFPYSEHVQLPEVTVAQKTNYPMTLVVEPVGDITLKAMFDARRFTPSTVERMLDQYARVIEELVDRAEQPLAQVRLLPEDDWQRQLAWNATDTPYPADSDLPAMFAAQVARTPNHIALVVDEQRLTYAELDRQSNRIAHFLIAQGVLPGDTIALMFEPSIELIAALVAVVKTGCAYAPLDPRAPRARIDEMLTGLKLRQLLTHQGLGEGLSANTRIHDLERLAPEIACQTATPVAVDADTRDLLYVIHTSGSTGKPKAAGVYHNSFINFIAWWNREFAFHPSDKNLLVNKVTFDLAQKNIWGALLTGGELHLATSRHFDPSQAVQTVAERGITWINCTPSMGYALAEACDGDYAKLSSMRYLFLGGEPVNKARIGEWMLSGDCHAELVNTYGPTECTDLCTTHRFKREEFVHLARPVAVGKALPNIRLYVLDRFNNPLPAGVAGEVIIGGVSIGSGYLNDPVLTAEKFFPDAYSDSPGARLYRTGDLGYFQDDGSIVVKGRVDFQVKVRGYRIELEEIDAHLRQHPQVRDAVTIVSRDDRQELISYVVADLPSDRDTAAQEEDRDEAFAPSALIEPLASEEKAKVLGFGIGAALDIPHPVFPWLFEAHAQAHPDDIALLFEQQRLSYAEINARANRMAHRLIALGVKPGEVIGLFIARGIEQIVAALAVMKTGAAYMPLDSTYPAERLNYMLGDSRAARVLAQRALLERLTLPLGCQPLLIDETGFIASVEASPETNPDHTRSALEPCSLAYVIYTSGSTGQPKGVAVPHRGLVSAVSASADIWQVNKDSVVLQFSTFSFDASVFEMGVAFSRGATLCLLSESETEPGPELVARIQTCGVTHALIPPSLLPFFNPRDLQSVAHIMVAGEACPRTLAETWSHGRRFYNAYGPSETSICASIGLFQPGDHKLTIGGPIANARLYVLDDALNLLPAGAVGELYIGGAGVGLGYLHRPDLSTERFFDDPYSDQPEARIYRTGDLVRWLDDGRLEFIGRTDHQVKVSGYRLELGEYESRLASDPRVKDALVVAREIGPDNRQMIAYVLTDAVAEGLITEEALAEELLRHLQQSMPVAPAAILALQSWPLTPNRKIDRKALPVPPALAGAAGEAARQLRLALGRHLEARLPEYMVPSVFVLLDLIPLNANGKVDRRALPMPADADRTGGGARIAPRNEIEEQLLAIWQKVLEREDIGVTDNFFELGGHSLSITQVLSRIGKTFQVKIPLSQLFEHLTIEQQATLIQKHLQGEAQSLPSLEAKPRPERLPLSFAQSRLWFLYRYEPDNIAYNVPNAMFFDHVADTRALTESLRLMSVRHESLRTLFVEEDGSPFQVILERVTPELIIKDLRGMDEGELADALRMAATEQAETTFNLERGPLMRYQLVQIADDRAVLMLTMHHIITDGWSMDIFVRELRQAYETLRREGEPAFEPLPLHYADYALWQQGYLQGEVLDKQLDYWRKQLGDSVSTINLPYDRSRPSALTPEGGIAKQYLPAELLRRLKTLSEQQGVTLFMTLLAAFDLLLYRWSGQDDFNVGTPIANRNFQETENIIGFFVNTLVLRCRIDETQNFLDLLRHVKETAQGAYDHQDVPFELLVDRLNPPRSPALNPFFQVLFALQTAYEDTSLLNPDEWVSRFDLQVTFSEKDGLIGSWEFSRALFERETIERMMTSLRVLLEQIVETPTRALFDFELISEASRQEALAHAIGTEQILETPFITRMIERQAELTPEATALIFEGTSLSYGAVNRRANRLAHYLRSHGLQPDTLVSICIERSMEMVIAALAVLKAGGAYVPLDPNYPAARLEYMLKDSDSRWLLTQSHILRDLPLPQGTRALLVDHDEFSTQLEGYGEDNLPLPDSLTPRSLAFVIYTSGSTGLPKGCLLTHEGLSTAITSIGDMLRLHAGHRMVQFATFSFDAATMEWAMTLARGASLVLLREEVAKNPERLMDALNEHSVTHAFFTPALLNFLDPARLPALGHLCIGGEQCAQHVADRWAQGRHFLNAYGPTETSIMVAMDPYRPGDAFFALGRPLPNTRLYVLDSHGKLLPAGVPGELFIGGNQVGIGYLNRSELTEERFLLDPFGEHPKARMYRSGDLVKRLADGRLLYLDRLDNQVKLRGYRIELGEIEARLRDNPHIKDALVFAREIQPGNRQLVAYVLTDAIHEGRIGEVELVDQLLGHIKSQLPNFMAPAAILTLAAWPMTPNRKIDRKALPLPDEVMQARDEYVPPANDLEAEIAELWEEMLDVSKIGVESDFFALGGHSLIATQMMARVRQRHGVSVPLKDFFLKPTVRFLADNLEKRINGEIVDESVFANLDGNQPIDWRSDMHVELPSEMPPIAERLEHVLLTGGTGFVGAYLIRELLEQHPSITLHCHVRARSTEKGLERIVRNMQAYNLWQSRYADRIEVVLGDLGKARIGMDGATWDRLSGEIDMVVHNGAVLNHVLLYPHLKEANLGSTKELIRFATSRRLKQFLHVSTLGIFNIGIKRKSVDEHTDITGESHVFKEGYNGTKWVAEMAVMEAIRKGLPGKIFRLGRIIADAQTGAGRGDDFVGLFLRTQIAVRAYPRFKLVEKAIPVDFVARSIVALAKDDPANTVYHLAGEEKFDWSQMLDRYVHPRSGFRHMMVGEWVDAVKERSTQEPLPFAPYLFYLDTDNAKPDEIKTEALQKHTEAALSRLGVKYRKIQDEAWRNFIRSLFDQEGVRFEFRGRGLFG